jgi:hypothetical protein
VFGQPRQEDLIAYIDSIDVEDRKILDTESWRVDLSP